MDHCRPLVLCIYMNPTKFCMLKPSPILGDPENGHGVCVWVGLAWFSVYAFFGAEWVSDSLRLVSVVPVGQRKHNALVALTCLGEGEIGWVGPYILYMRFVYIYLFYC